MIYNFDFMTLIPPLELHEVDMDVCSRFKKRTFWQRLFFAKRESELYLNKVRASVRKQDGARLNTGCVVEDNNGNKYVITSHSLHSNSFISCIFKPFKDDEIIPPKFICIIANSFCEGEI